MITRTRATVNPAAPEQSSNVLPWETSRLFRAIRSLEGKLRLKVNREKSAVADVEARSFLGHRLLRGGGLGLAPKSLARAKERLRGLPA